MSLHIEQLILEDFRGYGRFALTGLSDLTVIAGPNAVGKTNIVEGIQLLSSGESFRKPRWSETISWGAERARLEAVYTDGKRRIEHKLGIRGNDRFYEVNGKKKTASAIRGTCPCVLFIPDDLQMVKAASAQRRLMLDALGTQLSKSYAALKSDYQQALKQRNLLIKEEVHAGALFDSWDESLAVNGARLFVSRHRLFLRLAQHMERIYERIVPGEKLGLAYIPSWQRFDSSARQRPDFACSDLVEPVGDIDVDEAQEKLLALSRSLAAVELRRRTSLVGPHKDEVAFFIRGRNARMFASQGQQRTIVLVEKLAEVELVNEILGTEPVLLLDDVMSELDEAHRMSLTSFIEQSAQTFITTTNLGYFSEELVERANVVKVPIEGTRRFC